MKILLAPDSFKGTSTSIEVIDILEKVARQHFDDIKIIKVPVADGGEGTVDAIVSAAGGEFRFADVTGPDGKVVKAKYGMIKNNTAVIEIAQASGLPLVELNERNPLKATTYGTGELIKHALNEGVRNFYIGLGGSATNDGGIGALQALGAVFLDKGGNALGYGGQQLLKVSTIDTENLDQRINQSSFTVICDVTNTLTGEKGATYVYGPQKGADVAMLEELERGMINYKDAIYKKTGLDMDNIAGSGAAGGLGAAFIGFFNAQLKPGIETILDIVEFDKLLEELDFVVTGEGRIDGQSKYGKVPVGIARRSKPKNVPVVVIAGSMGPNAQEAYNYGIDGIMVTVNSEMTLVEALRNSKKLLADAADRMFRFIKIGRNLK